MDASQILPEAGLAENISPAEESTQQVLQFSDDVTHQGEQVQSDMDVTYNAGGTGNVSLEQFFERPIIVYETNWAVGANLTFDFNPWSLYFNNARVVNRISNYKLLNCKLHVKLVLNGTPFHYSRLLVSYTPRSGTNTLGPENRALVSQDAIGESQKPHFFANPTKSEGGQLDLPYFYPFNALDVISAEWSQMGQIFGRSLSSLQHANAGTDPVSLRFFVWASDVKLSVPTTLEPATITPQSDEYDSKPISGPANALASAASFLQNVPIVGPYARATTIAAGGVANIAKIFGMSKPTHSDETCPMSLKSGSLANTIGVDASAKLSLDPKQEVTIDPRTVGLSNVDEMVLKPLAMRESYLTTFSWEATDAPDALLFNSFVTPTLFAYNGDEIHQTPMCWVSRPFKYWRGTIKFRFQVVASSMHRGRLRLKYEPSASVIVPGDEYNTAFTRIVDIGEDSDFTIEVGWGQQASYLPVNDFGLTEPFSESALTVPDGVVNGLLQVFCVTRLTSPSTAGQTITVNVFVSAGDDFEVMDPSDDNIRNLTWILPDVIPESSQSTQINSISLGLDDHNFDPHHVVFHGDPVASWRQCLKRYCYHSMYSEGSGSPPEARKLVILSHAAFPNYRGDDPTGIYTTTNGRVNYSMMTLMNWVVPAYLGVRGSIRWKHIWRNNSLADFLNVSRSPEVSSFTSGEIPYDRSNGAIVTANNVLNSWSGTAITAGQYNPIIEIEAPFYSNKRFYNARNGRINTAYEGDFITFSVITNGGGSLEMMNFVAGGEDFSTFFFLSIPVCWKQTVLQS